MTREEWLNRMKDGLEDLFFSKPPYRLPKKLALSCGIPKGSSRAIGQCWDPSVSSDKTTHIFVCPSQEDPIQVVGILLHELIHAAIGIREGHGPKFKKAVNHVGLAGKVTSTVVKEGSELESKIKDLIKEVGPYPHKAMNKRGSVKVKRKKDSGRITLVSPEEKNYTVTMGYKKLLQFGAPNDPWGNVMVQKREEE